MSAEELRERFGNWGGSSYFGVGRLGHEVRTEFPDHKSVERASDGTMKALSNFIRKYVNL